MYWQNSCEEYEDLIAQCECGCSEDFLSCEEDCGCVPDCDGKDCGPDGCGDFCRPGCDADWICDDQGLCQFEATCVQQFGNGLTEEYGRLDGFLHYVVLPDDYQCPNDDNHVRLQIRMNNQYYNVAVNIDPSVSYKYISSGLHGGAWNEGWHTSGVGLDYSLDLDVSSNDFTAATTQQLSDLFKNEIIAGKNVSVYMEAYDASGGHNVHSNNYIADGAIVTDPQTNPHYYLFRFANQIFCDRCEDGVCNQLTGECEGGCTPDCGARECGPVPNGCGSSCGSCEATDVCNVETGICEGGCTPDCGARVCGPIPNGCGDSCGECNAPAQCNAAGECLLGWVIEADANDLGISWLTGIHGFGTDDVWAVGDVGILHRQNDVWALETAPLTEADSVNDIWGPSPDVLYAAADTLDNHWTGLVLSYTNGVWERDSFGYIDHPHFGIWGNGTGDVWMVGREGLIAHDDGTGWDQVHPGVNISNSLRAVWGMNQDYIWIVGAYGTILYSYNGEWGIDYADSPTNDHLYDLWGSSDEDIWAVGSNGTIVHYNGNKYDMWDSESSPTDEHLYGICGSAADEIWAVGANGAVLYYNGVNWLQLPPPTSYQLNECRINDQGQIWIVGEAGIIIRL